MAINSVFLIGRLAGDPDLSYTPNTQTAVTKFTLAVDRPRREGEEQQADFIRITVFGRQAETCDRYLSRGRQCAVLGRIQTGSYKNRDGATVYTTDVIAERVEFLGGSQRTEKEVIKEPIIKEPQLFNDLPDSFSSAEEDVPF